MSIFRELFSTFRSSFVNIPLQNPLSYLYVVLSMLLLLWGRSGT